MDIIMKAVIAFTVAAAASLAATATAAAAGLGPPHNLQGTAWTVQVNRGTDQLAITSQPGPGPSGYATCPPILGTIGAAAIRGWYCPSSGRIHFLRYDVNTGVTAAVFTGNVSDALNNNQQLYMGGTVTVVDPLLGRLGEYNFAAIN
jgi:hypothetical protein